jgi:hypothetical protein
MSNARSYGWPPVITLLPAAILIYINWEAVGLIIDQLSSRMRIEWTVTGSTVVAIWIAHAWESLRYLWKRRKLDRRYALFTIWSYTLALLLYSRAGCESIPAVIQDSVLGERRLWYVIACLTPTFIHTAMIMRGPRWKLLLKRHLILPLLPLVILAGTHPHWGEILLIGLIVIAPLLAVRWVRTLSIRKPAWQPYIYLAIRLTAAGAYPLSGILANDDIFLDIALQSWYHKGFYLLAAVNAFAMCIPELRQRHTRMAVFILRLTTSGFMLFMLMLYLPVLPQSAMALASFGFGYLMLAPVVLSVAKARILAGDIVFLRSHFSKRRLILVSVVGVILCTTFAVYILRPETQAVLAALYHRYASFRKG